MSLPDISDLPDLGHAQLAQHLDDHLEQLADSFLIGQTAAEALQVALTNVLALMQTVGSLAAANPRLVTDGATTTNDTTVTSTSAHFAAYDQGRPITAGTLPSGTTIAAVVDAQTVTASQPASASATAVTLTIG